MTRPIAIHLVHDDLRVIVRPFQGDYNAINNLWIAPNDARASGDTILRVRNLDPFDIAGFKRSNRQ